MVSTAQNGALTCGLFQATEELIELAVVTGITPDKPKTEFAKKTATTAYAGISIEQLWLSF